MRRGGEGCEEGERRGYLGVHADCCEGKEVQLVVFLVTTETAFQGDCYTSDKSTGRWLWTRWYHGIPC